VSFSTFWHAKLVWKCVFSGHNVKLMLGWWTLSGAPFPIRSIYEDVVPQPLHP